MCGNDTRKSEKVVIVIPNHTLSLTKERLC